MTGMNIRQSDLFTIATSGVNASNRLLQTTSNNIANVNTEGYVRERTLFATDEGGGVGRGTTSRVINQFAQNQLRRDTTMVGEWETYDSKVNQIDNLLSSEASSIAKGLSDFFGAVQTAADDPSSLALRDVVLTETNQLLTQMGTLASFLDQKEAEVNLEFTSSVNRANSLIETIGQLNEAILVARGNNPNGEPGALLNQRDNAITELSELLSIEVREGANQNGSLSVNLTSGESLVLEDGTFNVLELSSDADLAFKELQLSTNYPVNFAKQDTTLNIIETELGGSIGGLFRYRDEVLGSAQRDIGQLAIAFGDALNQQNALGMDLDQQLGGDIIALPEFRGLPFEGTLGTNTVTGRITPGSGTEVTDADIKITVTAVDGANQPTEITIEFLEGNGSPKLDASNNPIVFTNVAVTSGFNEIEGGIDIQFDPGDNFSVDDEFLMQPAKDAALNIDMATLRPEDLAFALPIRVTPSADNLGSAQVRSTVVTNTTVGTGTDRSAFDGANNIDDVASSPSPAVGAPAAIVFDSETQFRVLDRDDNLITTVTGVTDYENLLAQAAASPGWPAQFSPPAVDDYPGYDVSLQGAPAANDRFDIEYNTNGVDDNRNAIAMADLQEQPLVQLSSESTNQPRTFFEAYSSLVSRIGEQSANADITLQASEAMLTQSSEWFQSVSGVSLDEEAANLIRFQQSYAASAQILRTAQELFDTILAAAR